MLCAAAASAGPRISAVRVEYTTDVSARISWRTDVPADSQVKCGAAPGALSRVFPARDTGAAKTAEHAYVVWGLARNTRVYCQVLSASRPGEEPASAEAALTTGPGLPSTPIRMVSFGPTHRMTKIGGDTFASATLAGVTYVTGNDTGGPLLKGKFRNLVVYSISGNPPSDAAVVNSMDGFGEGGYLGIGNTTWKTGGLFATRPTAAQPNGALYLVVSRHHYTDTSAQDLYAQRTHQTASGALIVASTDKGVTWRNHLGKTSTDGAAPDPGQPLMFDGLFATPEFISYAPDGEPPQPPVDNSDAFIYALSNRCMEGKMGCWNNGDALYLGRVHREDIAALDARKWQFYTGGDGNSDAAWSSDPARAKVVFSEPNHVGQTGAHYIPALNRYVMMTWFFTDLNTDTDSWMASSMLRVVEAPKPWGPWTVVRSIKTNPQGFYNPIFSEAHSKKGGLISMVLMSGSWRGSGTYHPWSLELRFNDPGEKPLDIASPDFPGRGLVCLWDMSDRAGNTIADRTGNGHDLESSAVWNEEGLQLSTGMETYAKGALKEALNDFTVFVLFRAEGPIRNYGYDRLIEYHFPTGFSLNRLANQAHTFGIDFFGSLPPHNKLPYGLYSETFIDGEAHLLIATRRGSQVLLYDGPKRVGTQEGVTLSAVEPGPLLFGRYVNSKSNATIAAAGIYRRALDEQEIRALSAAIGRLAAGRKMKVH